MRRFIGGLSLAIAVVMATTAIIPAILLAAFALAILLASRKSRTIIFIGRDGLFFEGNLMTTWSNFVSASFLDQVPQLSKSSLGVSDQFYLAVRYRKEAGGAVYERKIPLTNLQDKSEEEILAAVRFFYQNSLNEGQPVEDD